MSGIVNQTGSRSGVIGTTVGTPTTSASGWIHIATKSISGASNITINQSDHASIFSSSYPLYMVTMNDYSDLASGDSLRLRYEYNGSIQSSTYGYHYTASGINASASSTGNSTSTSDIQLAGDDTQASSGGNRIGHLVLYINEPDHNTRQLVQWRMVHHAGAGGDAHGVHGVGVYDGASYPVTGLYFFTNGGNNFTATFKVFGLSG
tara:strand:+ start:471 stop:1088 length:618 start_codon:yes stop_codon:yes gene_type:complete